MKISVLPITALYLMLSSLSLEANNNPFSSSNIVNSCTFIKSFGEDGVNELVYTMIEAPTGGFLVGGSRENNSLLLYISEDGDLIWSKEIDFLSGGDEIYDLMIDSEGFLIGNSRLQSNGANQSAVFKYDYLNNNMLWIRIFSNPSESRFEGMVEKPDGNYVFYGRVQPVNACDATLVELDKDTGEKIKIRGFHLDHCEILIGAIIYDNSIFAVGRYSIDGIGISRFRASLTRFDLDGNEMWSRLYTTSPNPSARTYMSHILAVDDKILIAGRGDLNGTEFDDVPIFLYEIDPATGEYNWAKTYDVQSSSFNRPSQMIAATDGYYFPGIYNSTGDRDLYLMKTDFNGNPIWQKGYDLDGDQSVLNEFIVVGDNIFFSGRIQNPNGSDTNVAFGKINLDGSFDDTECDISVPVEITASDYNTSYQGNVTLDDFDLPNSLTLETKTIVDTPLESEFICECIELEIEICDNNQDDDGDGLIDCDDPDLQDSCCCLVPILLDLGPDVSFCDNETLLFDAGNDYISYTWQDGFQNQNYAVMEAGVYSVIVVDECEVVQVDSVVVTSLLSPFTFDTLMICENDTAFIFGNAETEAGNYVGNFFAENGCDSTHQITLQVVETLQSFGQVMTCPGDSVLIFGNFETEAGDYTQTQISEADCDSTHTITLEIIPEMSVSFQTLPTCENEDNGFVQAIVSGGLPPYQYLWETSNQNTDTLSNLAIGEYGLTILDDFGCQLESTFSINTLADQPVELSLTDETCFGNQDGVLTILNANSGLSFSLDGVNFDTTTVIENLPSAAYTLSVLANNGCEQTLDFTIAAAPELLLTLPPDTTLCLGDSLQMIPQTNSIDELIYQWSPPLGLSCDTCPKPFAQPFDNIIYNLNIIDENGCTATDSIAINVIFTERLFAPNVFSPNNDGINDYFYLQSDKGVKEILEFKIFGRWGNLVFETANIQPNQPLQGWNGYFKNELLNPDVFVWMAKVEFLNGATEIFKGDILLVK